MQKPSKPRRPTKLLGPRNPAWRPRKNWSIIDEIIKWASEERGYDAPTNTALVELLAEESVKRGSPEWEITKQAVANWRAKGYPGDSSWPGISAVTGIPIATLYEAKRRRQMEDVSPIPGFRITGPSKRSRK